MPKRDDKRKLRRLKREVKQAGNRKRRRQLQRDLVDNPAEAAHTEVSFGRSSSASLNGIDRDATRRRRREDAPEA